MHKVKKTTDRPNIYQIVTDRIIASLKNGVIPWEKPWTSPTFQGGPFPRNFRTGRPYRGINIFLLCGTDYSTPFWLTFKQAQELGGCVRKGEKGERIVFYKQLHSRTAKTEDSKNSESADKKDRLPFVLTYYTVFNVAQCDGLNVPTIEEATEAPEVNTDEACEAIVNGWESRPSLRLDNPVERNAFYRSSTDTVSMPLRSRFVNAAHYYATLFHELIHSTGHENRLNRPAHEAFGDETYSKEELVAETGAAFLCAIAGIANENTERNTTAYIQHWIARFEQDNRLIVQAAALAQKAVDMITGQRFVEDDEAEEGSAEDTGASAPLVIAVAA